MKRVITLFIEHVILTPKWNRLMWLFSTRNLMYCARVGEISENISSENDLLTLFTRFCVLSAKPNVHRWRTQSPSNVLLKMNCRFRQRDLPYWKCWRQAVHLRSLDIKESLEDHFSYSHPYIHMSREHLEENILHLDRVSFLDEYSVISLISTVEITKALPVCTLL